MLPIIPSFFSHKCSLLNAFPGAFVTMFTGLHDTLNLLHLYQLSRTLQSLVSFTLELVLPIFLLDWKIYLFSLLKLILKY